MQLSPEQIARFYRIWLALLHFVNEERHLVPAFSADEKDAPLAPSDEMHVRNALWADDGLRERFIALNPADLPAADLAVVARWQYRRAGSFSIVRSLKTYTVFLSEEEPQRAYGVLGLSHRVEEMLPVPLPTYVQTVLLPFEGQIIYDGLLQSYAVVLGPGIRARLKQEYRNAREREGIIITLGPAAPSAQPQEMRTVLLARNTKIMQAFRRGLSSKTVEQHVATIEDFARTCLLQDDPPRGLLEMQLANVQQYLSTSRHRTAPTSFKRFVRFLLETGRMDYEQAAMLDEWLKHASVE